MGKLTKDEWSMLHSLSLRPHGAPVRGEANKATVLALADKTFVCDPHAIGEALFTRITPAGRAALSQREGE